MEGYILDETYDFHYAWEQVCRLRLLVLQVWNEVSFHDSALFMLSLLIDDQTMWIFYAIQQ